MGPSVIVHNVTWVPVQSVVTDLAVDRNTKPTTFLWERVAPGKSMEDREPIDYIRLMFPMQFVESFVRWTNILLVDDPHAPVSRFTNTKDTNATEFFVFFSMRLLMSVDYVGEMASYWAEAFDEEAHPCTFPRSYGKRFKVSRHRFEALERNVVWHDPTQVKHFICPHSSSPCSPYALQEIPPNDTWYQIRQLIEAFNARRLYVVDAGGTLLVDESMSKWYGHVSWAKPPHVTFMRDKPVDTGVCFRVLADGETKVFLKLEIQENKEAMSRKRYQVRKAGHGDQDPDYLAQLEAGDVHQAHTAMVLRLTEGYFSSKRLVLGDAFYFSLSTARALLAHGLHGCGMVKQATKGYPMAELIKLRDGPENAIREKALITEAGDHKVLALGYYKDGSLSTIISTVGHTLRTTDGKNRPQVLADMRKAYGAIDEHNAYRQGYVGSEARRRKDWTRRIEDTIFGIIAVDAYLAYVHDCKILGRHPFSVISFFEKVAAKYDDKSQIAGGAFMQKEKAAQQQSEPALHEKMEVDVEPDTIRAIAHAHQLRPLAHHNDYKSKRAKYDEEQKQLPEDDRRGFFPRLTCSVCGELCHHYCVPCSDKAPRGTIIAVHSMGGSAHSNEKKLKETDNCWCEHLVKHLGDKP